MSKSGSHGQIWPVTVLHTVIPLLLIKLYCEMLTLNILSLNSTACSDGEHFLPTEAVSVLIGRHRDIDSFKVGFNTWWKPLHLSGLRTKVRPGCLCYDGKRMDSIFDPRTQWAATQFQLRLWFRSQYSALKCKIISLKAMT